jgi:hypothetical protein
MRSCNERTILHCVESYLYYIILINKKKYFLRSETREKINRLYTYIVENITTAKIVRAERNSILQPLLICISIALKCKHYTVEKFKYQRE